ncbi:LGFP repeat-containing protein [Klenkia taihuensis]|uniref:Uncharacterized conserved protein, contains LGFP repeats n=1 Tax=Klenkia taihuensis TaxID=1225127 RepID=A0A1I1K6A2_9ACTN|nr:hypothetical protein [Klenkia taihuensis]GHE10654.1 hypothetical protein GCM10011381_20640 [Klenkia taihuensis]SFC53080.1 Uncharacterized conserved protein, contains LGFP repeats [Klenkia taihuensis]
MTGHRAQRWTTWALGFVLLGGLAFGAFSAGRWTESADLSRFNPGNIISDGVFYDTSTMSASDIQAFLAARGSSCAASNSLCMDNYRMDTYTRPADTRCPLPYAGATQETAASIIAKVARACGVNPQVLLVTLQKEQGLVTASNPTTGQYAKAVGFGCPDTAACDTTYNGLFNQLYSAARQFKNYQATPSRYGYVAGRTNFVQYNPNAACGGQSVYIENQATAGLYNYTPYTPNGPALAAGYGRGDGCSAYGNRNFFNYFTDWFGSTQSSGGSAVAQKYLDFGGASSYLGLATGDVDCRAANGGCYQRYAGGAIYWSPASGARVVRGAILQAWGGLGYEYSLLGYPVGDEAAIPGGYFSSFQGGAIYWSPSTGAHFVRGGIYAAWAARGYEAGALGWPTGDETPVPGGYFSAFQNGSIYWSPATGANAIGGDIYTAWGRLGYESGALGFPTSSVTPLGAGAFSMFQGGAIYWSPTGGAHALRGSTYSAWARQGYETGGLGWPTSGLQAVGGGTRQDFTGGSIWASTAGGAHAVRGGTLATWQAAGGPAGVLGFPVSDVGTLRAGSFQMFTGGAVYTSPSTGSRILRGEIYGAWARQGYEGGPLGYPVTDVQDLPGGQRSDFTGGSILWSSATGAHRMGPVMTAAYDARGGSAGLGFPTTDEFTTATGGRVVHLTNGNLYWSAATGAVNVPSRAFAAYAALEYENGVLGYPTADAVALPQGLGQVVAFQGGSVVVPAAGPAYAVPKAVDAAWQRSGGASGPFGLPAANSFETTSGGGGIVQYFQGGTIYAGAATGGYGVRGETLAAWGRTGYEYGPLGMPTGDEVALAGGTYAPFQGGAVYWSPGGGAHAIRGAIYSAWASNGYEAGRLGFPTSDQYAVSGGVRMDFQGGTITLASNGQTTVTVR